jgi:hypothetical protein
MKGINDDEICNFIELTRDKVKFTITNSKFLLIVLIIYAYFLIEY